MIVTYVAGFLFCPIPTTPMHRVLLVRKNHPAWQDGLLNGIGGVVEAGETVKHAMTREFMEEANYRTNLWDHFATEKGPGYIVEFFRHTIEPREEWAVPLVNDRGEALEWHNPRDMRDPVIGNLNWLLPLALDPRPLSAAVVTEGDIRGLKTW